MTLCPTDSPTVAATRTPIAATVAPNAPKGKSEVKTTNALSTAMTDSLSLCPQILAHNQAGRNKV